ncbi:zinc finger protein 830-like [Amphiura filiformis]|uniref:zinc finger protein 830-like n=1 Tax=Amphiura filiformis TaxID=82378 RepID=UPI003B20EFBC
MASKTKVNLRDLMKKQRTGSKSSSKRIESPLAKYNSIGQLWCVVCNAQVKSEIVWPAHIQGRKHKDNVATLKVAKTAPARPPPEPAVVKLPPAQPKSILKRRPDDPSVYRRPADPSPMVKKPKVEESPDVAASSGLPADFFDSSSTSSNNKTQQTTNQQCSGSTQTNSSSNPDLPADFFDASVSSSSTVPSTSAEQSSKDKASNQDKTESNKSNMAEVLPEGFFDDPVIDAKVRNVEVRNTMEEEWTKFQKEMETQQQVSENLQEEDEEEAQIERNIDEIDEQINCFAKVEALRDKQDAIKDMKAKKSKDIPNRDSEESSSSADEAEFDELLDWRSKGHGNELHFLCRQ